MIRNLTLFLAAALLVTGCSRPTYINVPNDGSDAAINSPNWQTTVQIERAALAYLIDASQILGDIGVRFPAGTSDRTAISIVAGMADNVYVEGQTPSDEYQLVEVREIMGRGGIARVDIIRPGTLREREFVEVHLAWSVWDGWVAERLQVRNFGVDRVDPSKLAAPGAEPAAQPRYEEVEPPDSSDDTADDAAE